MAVAAVADREKTDSLLSYYDEHGYVVVRNLISRERIANLLALYARDIVPSRQRFFRQSSSCYERNRINPQGHVRQSFLDIHDYERFPEFSAASRDIFCGQEMMETVSAITGAPHHNLMQTMLFDLGTASGPHQDRYDLDRIPNGSLIAAWIALEDIREEAGRFYVMPGSHERCIKRIGDYVEQHRSSRFAPALRQGDVLLWNPRAVHGSLPTRDERYSRKSLTAHYLPSHQGFDKHYKEYEGVRFYRNQPEYSLLNHVVYALKARLRQGSA
ncbi:MAG TPA: phytanoyl-CoA dioxygenase family protein [Burkholderiales bacterium]|jgi:phytanoyl-CoA hydroxylase|nr:phytanoyl-CoA dioxygenase family protein [Burkholderiales bacterium]